MILILVACLAGGAALVRQVIYAPLPELADQPQDSPASTNVPATMPLGEAVQSRPEMPTQEPVGTASAEPATQPASEPEAPGNSSPKETTVEAAIAEYYRIRDLKDFVERMNAEKALHDRLSEEWKGVEREFRIRISGRVTDGDDLPVAGAKIEIGGWISTRPEEYMLKHIRTIRPQGEPEVVTDHAGYFEHEWVFKDSALTLEISLFYEAKAPDGRYCPQDVLGPYRPGSHEARVECRLPAARPLTFKFTDRHGKPVSGVLVDLLAEAPVMSDFGQMHMRRHYLTTDEAGIVRFVGLGDDTYHLSTAAPWRVAADDGKFALTQADLPQERTIVLTRDISYAVRVEGTPPLKSGITVRMSVRRENGETEYLSARLSKEGVAVFWGMPPDTVSVQVSVEGYKEADWRDVRVIAESDHDGGTVQLEKKS